LWPGVRTPPEDPGIRRNAEGRCQSSSESNYGAGGFADDLVDQVKRVRGARAEPDQRNIGPFSGSDGANVLNLDLSGYYLVPERNDDWRDEREAILALVGDEDAQMASVGGRGSISKVWFQTLRQ